MKRIFMVFLVGTTPSGNFWQSCDCPSSTQEGWWGWQQVCPLGGGQMYNIWHDQGATQGPQAPQRSPMLSSCRGCVCVCV